MDHKTFHKFTREGHVKSKQLFMKEHNLTGKRHKDRRQKTKVEWLSEGHKYRTRQIVKQRAKFTKSKS